MFYAETHKGNRLSAADYENGKETLYCPGCKEAVFFKKGRQKLAHFAHYAHSDCKQFSEGETTLHLMGKQKLFSWLMKQGLVVEMEAWLPELKQRPDLLVKTPDDRKIVFEYQCSPISTEELQARTDGYQNNGYEVIWLGGIDYQIKTYLTEKQSRFMQYGGTFQLCFTFYDSEKDHFHYYYDFHYTSANRVECSEKTIPLWSVSLPIFLAFYHGTGKRKVEKVRRPTHENPMPLAKRMSLVQRTDESHRLFLEKIYLSRQSIHSLPTWLFTHPFKIMLYQTPNYIWNFYFLCWLREKEIDELIKKEDLIKYSQSQMTNKTLSIMTTLFIPEEILLSPMYSFLSELEKRGFVKQTHSGLWQVCKKNEIFP